MQAVNAIFPHFSKPVARFIGDMMYGIMKEKDVKLSSIVRALKEETTPKKVEDRLSRMLSAKGLEAGLHGVIAAEGARRVHRDTLIILDPSDVQKPYAKKMEYLAKVWDGSKGDVGDNLGFWGCMAVACESGGRRPVPLHFRLWSADSPGFVSENDEVEGVVKAISRHTKKRDIYVYDRGGDNIEFYRFLLSEGLDFIVRLKERYVRSWKRTVMCGELAWQCRMLYREVVKFDHHGNVSALLRPDFHLRRSANRHFTLCLQGCGNFHARKIGEPPRQRAMLRKSRDQPCNLRNDLVFKLLHLSFPAFPHLSTLFTEKTGGAQFIASEAIAANCGPPKSSDVATVEAICFPSLYTR